MTNKNEGDNPSRDEGRKPSPESEASQEPQNSSGPSSGINGKETTAQELAREFRWVEGAQVIINGSLAVIGIIALCIYHGQLQTMHGQLSQSQTALETQQRAWVGAWAEMKRKDSELLDTIDYRVIIKNTGPTPALNVSVTPAYMWSKRDYLLESDFSLDNKLLLTPDRVDKVSRFTVLPNDTSTSPYYGFNVHHTPRSHWKELNPPITYLFLCADITYDDIFGKCHTTSFCERAHGTDLIWANLDNNIDAKPCEKNR